jgi:cytochrome b involved in lipid metabolism
MSDTDMILVSAADKAAYDLYSSEKSRPPDDTDIGGEDNLEQVNVTISGSQVSANFTRKFNTGDKYDAIITPDSAFSIVFAYLDSGSGFDYHSSGFGSATLSFYSTQAQSGIGDLSTGADYGDDYSDHGKAMSSVWMCLVPVGIIAARYFKGFQLWFYVHFVLMSASVAVTAFSVSAIYKHNKAVYDNFDTDQRYHSRMGLVIGSLVFIQGLLGVLIRWFSKKKETLGTLPAMRWLHWLVGWSMTIVALIEVKYGWDLKDDDKLDFIYPLYGVLAAIFLIFEVLNRFGYKPWMNRRSFTSYTYHEVASEVAQGKHLAFFNDLVLDVKSFASSHPGGEVMMRATLGEDLGKYIYASSSWNSPPHIHSVSAHSLIAQLAIGKVKGPTVFSDNRPLVDWRLVAKGKLNRLTWRLTLKSKEVSVLNEVSGVEWIGKHLLLTYRGVSKYYSFVHCLNSFATWHSQARNRGADLLPLSTAIQVSEGQEVEVERGEGLLTLVVKEYPLGRLTPLLTGAPVDTHVHISGPFGPGLALTESFKGAFVGLAAGTGLLPFLDLAYLLWRRSVGETTLLPDIRLTLHVSFSSKEDSFSLDLLRALEVANPQQFRLVVNFSDSAANPLTDNSLASLLNVQEVARVAVCGPSRYNRWAEEMLERIGVSRSKVLVL